MKSLRVLESSNSLVEMMGACPYMTPPGIAGVPRTDILGTTIDAQSFAAATDTLMQWATGSGKYRISTCVVYTVMLARDNTQIRAALRHADMVTADGTPLVWLQRAAGYAQAERVYGPDIMHSVCQRTAGTPVRHLFYGGQAGIARQLAARLETLYPGLQVADAITPPVIHPGIEPDPDVVHQLNSIEANIIWVGLGSPKQDLWMADYRPLLNANLLIGVGAAFDIVSGNKRQAPYWMRQCGLEWSFRLAQEPRRLWRRYLIYNPRFLLALMLDRRGV